MESQSRALPCTRKGLSPLPPRQGVSFARGGHAGDRGPVDVHCKQPPVNAGSEELLGFARTRLIIFM